jgi:hypothetical protein
MNPGCNEVQYVNNMVLGYTECPICKARGKKLRSSIYNNNNNNDKTTIKHEIVDIENEKEFTKEFMKQYILSDSEPLKTQVKQETKTTTSTTTKESANSNSTTTSTVTVTTKEEKNDDDDDDTPTYFIEKTTTNEIKIERHYSDDSLSRTTSTTSSEVIRMITTNYNNQRCNNKECKHMGINKLDEDLNNGVYSCGECGIVQGRVIAKDMEAGAQKREFEEDVEEEKQHDRFFKLHSEQKKTYQATQALLNRTFIKCTPKKTLEEQEKDRYREIIVANWKRAGLDSERVGAFLDESASVLYRYTEVMMRPLKDTVETVEVCAAVIYMVVQSFPQLKESCDPMFFVKTFLAPLNLSLRKRMNKFITQVNNLERYMGTDKVLGTIQVGVSQVNMYWKFVQSQLELYCCHPKFPITPNEKKLVNQAFLMVQNNPELSSKAQTHTTKVTAAVIYYNTLCNAATYVLEQDNDDDDDDTNDNNNNKQKKKVKMSQKLAAEITQTSTVSLSCARKHIYINNSVKKTVKEKKEPGSTAEVKIKVEKT